MLDDRPDSRTLVDRIMTSRVGVLVVSGVPVPLSWVRFWLLRDDKAENAKDSWGRLRDGQERVRYEAVRATVEKYGAAGFVLDVGSSQGILREGLAYGRYLGVDRDAGAVQRGNQTADERARFVCADGATFVADAPPDVIVLNEVIYYLPDPVAAVCHHARQVSPGGVVVVSIFARSWASRRLLGRLASSLDLVETTDVTASPLAWTVAVYRLRA